MRTAHSLPLSPASVPRLRRLALLGPVNEFPYLPLFDPGEPTLAPQRQPSLERAGTAQASSLPSGPCVELTPPDTPTGVRSRPAAPAPSPTVPPSPTRAQVCKIPLVSRHGGRPRQEYGASTAPPPPQTDGSHSPGSPPPGRGAAGCQGMGVRRVGLRESDCFNWMGIYHPTPNYRQLFSGYVTLKASFLAGGSSSS